MPTSTASSDLAAALAERVRDAERRGGALTIVGGGTKAFYGRPAVGEALDVSGHRGVIAYEPSELVITARAGTPIMEIEALLAQRDQMLAFEPPVFGPASTLGGVIAAGLSGPCRPFTGAVRDFVLGVTVLDGRGRALRFGGTVFKNVAGFDTFRLMAGALGCLGVLLDVSLRVTPRPRSERPLALEMNWSAASAVLDGLMRRPVPLSGAFHADGRLHLRLSGPEEGVARLAAELGGEAETAAIWEALRHMSLPRLRAARLWRVSVPRTADLPERGGDQVMDWAGAQRWLASDEPGAQPRADAAAVGGHATLFRGATGAEAVFTPLAPGLMALHRRLKAALDPAGVFNPGRMYEGL